MKFYLREEVAGNQMLILRSFTHRYMEDSVDEKQHKFEHVSHLIFVSGSYCRVVVCSVQYGQRMCVIYWRPFSLHDFAQGIGWI